MDYSTISYLDYASVFNSAIAKIKQDPIKNFVRNKNFLNLEPTPVQEVILKIVFNKELDSETKKTVTMENSVGEEFGLASVEMTEVEIYEFLTEKKYNKKKMAKIIINKIDLICGRRSGKTLLAAVIALYSAVTNNWRPFLYKTPFATVLILSHSREFSDEVLDIIKSFIEESAFLSRLKNNRRKQTASALNLVMPFISEDQKLTRSFVQIKVAAASSKTTRGAAICAAICDEIAYWNLDETMKETDVKILNAVRPAMKQFGNKAMLIKLSSPGIRQGTLYSEYEMDRNGQLPETYAVFKAPTWVMNTIIPVEEFYEEYKLDPNTFDVEFRANFTDALSNFIQAESVDRAVQKGIKFLAPSGNKAIKYFAAIDAAFKSDKFTFSLVGISDNRVTQYISKGWQGTRTEPVKAVEVAQWIKTALADFPVDHVAADQFAFQPLKEIFDLYGITLQEYTFSPKFKKQIYFNLKRLHHSDQIDLLDNPVQTGELKQLVVEQSSTGTIKIGHPAGGSDDFSDSLAVASFLAVENQSAIKFEFQSTLSIKDYSVKTDIHGISIGAAPSPEMLVNSGHLSGDITDNTSSYGIDPRDGKFKHISNMEDEDDDDGPQFIF